MKTRNLQIRQSSTWESGLKLQATVNAKLFLPGGLIGSGGSLGSIIELSRDDIEVGFKESESRPGTYASIIIYLKPGDAVKLNKATEFAVDSDVGEVVFNVLEE